MYSSSSFVAITAAGEAPTCKGRCFWKCWKTRDLSQEMTAIKMSPMRCHIQSRCLKITCLTNTVLAVEGRGLPGCMVGGRDEGRASRRPVRSLAPGRPAQAERSPPATALRAALAITHEVLTTALGGQNWHRESVRNLSSISQLARTTGGIQTQFRQPLESTLEPWCKFQFLTGILLHEVEDISSALYLYCPGVSHALRAQRW